MIIAVLVVYGLCLGSFVNALVWRIYEQDKEESKKKSSKQRLRDLSINKGRSMCPHCSHTLFAKDLLPVVSWVILKGKCRYCHERISGQYPFVELLTAGLFVASYIWWPTEITGIAAASFGLWLLILTGLMALTIYDLRWMLLPNRIMYPLYVLGAAFATTLVITSSEPLRALILTILAAFLGGGVFYIIYQVSDGKWIGGGDVKLGWLLGLLVAAPQYSFLFIFIASLLGTLVAIPTILRGRLNASRVIPFGPFLTAGAFITLLFGADIITWYQFNFLP